MQFTRRRVLALLVLSCILLLTLDARGSSSIDSAKSVFADVFSPFKGVGRMISTPVRNAWKGMTDYDELERQNDILREQIALQEGDSIAAQAALRDYQELVAQLDLPSLRDFTNVTAQVLSYSPSNVQQTIEINEGESRGIRIGMPVVNAAGMVGKVVEVFENSSLVLLITDPSYSVTVRIVGVQPIPGSEAAVPTTTIDPAAPPGETATATTADPNAVGGPVTLPAGVTEEELLAAAEAALVPTTTVPPTTTTVPRSSTTVDFSTLPNRERGSLEGIGPDKNPVVRFLNNDNKARQIKEGDVVITDGGLESLAPAGLNIGVVGTVTQRPGTAGPLVEVIPAANLQQINFVRVIMYLPQSEAIPD